MREAARVLKNDGKLAIADIRYTRAYASELEACGLKIFVGLVAAGLRLAVSIHKMDDMSSAPVRVPEFVARTAAGDREAIAELLARELTRPGREVALRLAPRLRGRVDASDEISEPMSVDGSVS